MRDILETPIGPLLIEETGGYITRVEILRDDWVPDGGSALTALCKRELSEYFEGSRKEFSVPVKPQGTAYRQQVWHELRGIRYGETASYKDIATRLGNPNSSRAVGGANHHNPVLIIIPCHRVIGSDGALTGFGGGLDKKKWLLEHEKRYYGGN